ncbi:MAG: sigma-54-dependent Fis family transcriptional regulator [Ignavibacteriales bacterium CG_4_9_14_3_um_filter_34_10]|nr:MAG: sigma-54-dependent Fis family transcriptional regulator [Ignavibacteriales bacterium CG_4_9_14_3_um_filter_34_10]
MTREEFQQKFGIIGRSKAVKDLVDIIMQVAKSDISVLIYGESGVGKEIFANAIHGYSSRAIKKMVSVNCGAIPEGILESELFGHEKGSFTGAVDARKGYFEISDEGTLFLDEIGEMPLTTQVKLLRVLETSEFMRLGSERTTKVNVRIIAASNKELQAEVDNGKFRKDLFFRLKAVSINIPPLRDRKEDVNLLLDHFLQNYSLRNKRNDLIISNDAYELLNNYYWPGNIRELKNVVETAAALSKTNVLTSMSFMNLLSISSSEMINRNLPVYLNKGAEENDRELIYRALIEIKKDLIELKSLAVNHVDTKISTDENVEMTEVVPLEVLERKAIINALAYTKWNKKKAANLLNISERTLYRKIKEYDIQ